MSWNTTASDLILSHIRSLTAKYNSAGTPLQQRRLASEISENYSELIRKAPPQEAATYKLQASYWNKKSREIEVVVETADECPTGNSLLFTPRVQYNEIGGYQRVKTEIRKTVVLSQAIPHFRSNILLYGPPGTGKTLLANGIATEIRSPFYLGSVANLASKYFGEASRQIEALYSTARGKSNSIVFLDEIETIAGKRGDNDAAAKMVTSLLTALDSSQTKNCSTQPVTIAATNLPWELDEAILSRFSKRTYVGLPTEKSIAEIIRLNLHGFSLDKTINLTKLSRTCRHKLFAGREIESLCRNAIGEMIEDMNKDFDIAYVKLSDTERENYKHKLNMRPLTEFDFERGLEKIKSALSPALLNKYDEWRSQS